jgi:hypothetical protein
VLLLRCWFFGETAGESIMAWLEKRGDGFRICFRFSGQKFTRSLFTHDARAANGALARLEDNLRRVELGTLEIPDTGDLSTFLLSDGRTAQRPALPRRLTLKELFSEYFAQLPEGALEECTTSSMKTHQGQLSGHFGMKGQHSAYASQIFPLDIVQFGLPKFLLPAKTSLLAIASFLVFRSARSFHVFIWGCRFGAIFRPQGCRIPSGINFPVRGLIVCAKRHADREVRPVPV